MAGNLTAMIAAAFSGSAAPPVTSDPYFEYTTLLLPGNGTNGAQNNTFLDSSTNNFTITRNGNTTQGTFSPFSQTGWGNYFNGSSYLSAGTTLFNYTTGNASTTTFTIEAFVYLTSYQTAANIYHNPCIIGKGDVYLNLGVNGSGNLIFYHFDGTVRSITGSTVIPLNTWTYVAVTVTGGTATIYVNGSSVGSGTWYGIQSAGQNTTSLIGRASTNASSLYFNGYMSNLRVSTVARTITTPTVAYVNDANTALLTAQSNRFVDNSSSPITLTLTGSPSIQAFSPFNPTSSWSAATYGGSGYFDGNGDYLSAPSSSAFAVDSIFTIELWLYPTAYGTYATFVYLGDSAGSLQFGLNSGNIGLAASGVAWRLTSSTPPVLNSWNHIVLVRSGTGSNQTSMFLNGNRIANGTVTDAWTSSTTALIQGSTSSYQITGWMSGVRIVKGTAVYDPTQTTLTVPTAPLTAITNTSILLNFTNAGIYDATSKNDLETVDGAQISTAQSKWGGSSMAFDGSGDYLFGKSNDLLSIASGDFTLEFWVYRNSSQPSTYPRILTIGAANYSALIFWLSGGSNILVDYSTSGSAWTSNSFGGATLSATTWTHLALVRSSGNLLLFKDGTQQSTSVSNSSFLLATPEIRVATLFNPADNYFAGYIQDLRITKGYARYTANFTPPTAAFPTL